MAVVVLVFADNDRAVDLGKGKQAIIDLIYSLATGLLVTSDFDLCPFNGKYYGGDSSVFIYIARMMHKGKVPYRDMFDHKGSWLYFIEYVGEFLGDTGIWILELLACAITVFFMLKISRLLSKKVFVPYLTAFASIYLFGFYLYLDGNLTEFWALPFTLSSLYIIFRFFRKKEYSPLSIVYLGFAFGVVFFIRCNLVSPWAFFVPVIIIYLIKLKRSREIIKCILLFTAGVALALCPVLIYHGVTGSFQELYKDYWLYNISYVKVKGGSYYGILSFGLYAKYFLIGWIAVIVASIVHRKSRFMHCNTLFLLATFILSLVSGRDYEHYFISCIPCFVVPVTLFLDILLTKKLLSDKKDQLTKIIYMVPVLLLALVLGWRMVTVFDIESKAGYYDGPVVTYVKENTSPDDDVIYFFGNGLFYICSDRYTDQKFFYQFPLTYNKDLYYEFIEDLKTDTPDMLVFLNDNSSKEGEVPEEDWSLYNSYVTYKLRQDINELMTERGYILDQKGSFFAYKKG